MKEDQNEVASGFTEFRKPQIDSVTTRPKREKLGCLCADCLFIEQHYQQPDSIEATGFCACNLCDLPDSEEEKYKESTLLLIYAFVESKMEERQQQRFVGRLQNV